MKGKKLSSILFVPLLLVLSVALSMLYSDDAKALDDAPYLSEMLTFEIPSPGYYGISCSVSDFTDTYLDLWNDDHVSFAPDMKTAYLNAATGDGAFMIKHENFYVDQYNMGGGVASLYWVEDADNVTFTATNEGFIMQATNDEKLYHAFIGSKAVYITGSGSCDWPEDFTYLWGSCKSEHGGTSTPNCYDTGVVNGAATANETTGLFKSGGAEIEYSEDYEYNPIGDTGGGKDEREIIKPDFSYTVTDKSIVAKDRKQNLPEFTPDEGYTFEGYEVEWSLIKCIGETLENDRICDELGSDQKGYEIQQAGKQFKNTVVDYGDYYLEAQYLVQQCYRYPSYPATPDHCFYVEVETEFPQYNWQRARVHLDINGETFNGDTSQMECDVSGFCKNPADGLGFFRGLDEMNNHGLTKFLTAPITFYGTLINQADNCTAINVPFIQGRSITLSCLSSRYWAWSNTIMTIYTTVLIAGSGYIIAFSLFRTIKDIKSPDKDGVEVARL